MSTLPGNTRIWLCSSVFGSKHNWHILLQQAIGPLLKALTQKQVIHSYQLEFNYLSGENIRVSVLCDDEEKDGVSRYIDDHFTGFFSVAGLDSKTCTLPVNGIFLPFPANTVQYGLYRETAAGRQAEINKQVSDCILEVLSGETIDENVILTLAFYLNISLIKALAAGGLPAFVSGSSVQLPGYAEQADSMFPSYFEENREILLSVYEELMAAGNASVPLWVKAWLDLCCLTVQAAFQEHPSEKAHAVIKSLIIESIERQLGFSAEMRLLLNYFINSVLQIQSQQRRLLTNTGLL